MPQKWFKMVSIAFTAGVIGSCLIWPALIGLAAPATLPNCGHNNISNSPTVTSGPPDLARSNDLANVAVVWAEGADGVGLIRLAFSNQTARTWTPQTIDAGPNNQDPSLVFDAIDPNVVHVAYQKGTLLGNATIVYARCTLGGGCETVTVKAAEAQKLFRNPELAVNSAGQPLVVYQESSTIDTNEFIYYAYRQGGTGGNFSSFRLNAVTPIVEQNPALVFSNGKAHIAYAKDSLGPPSNQPRLEYRSLNAATLSGAGPLTVVDADSFIPNTAFVTKPDFPALAASGDSLVLVWGFERVGNPIAFNLVYNRSNNNGVDWVSGGAYRHLPSDQTNLLGPAAADNRSSPGGGDFTRQVRPDVTLHISNSIVMPHVVWHEETSNTRRDIMYAYFNGTQWRGTPILSGTGVISLNNVTDIYGDGKGNSTRIRDNARPKVLFGAPANRMQVVYMAETLAGDIFELRYNGWQLGDPADPTVTFQVKDSDCDTIADSLELPPPADWIPGDPATTCGATGNTTDRDEFNCNGNQDELPDFLDTDTDGDGVEDDIENTDGTGGSWRDPTKSPPRVLLPVIVKG